MIELEEVCKETVDEVLDWFANQSIIQSHRLLDYNNDESLAFVRLSNDYRNSESIPVRRVYRDYDCFPIRAATVENCREHTAIIIPSEERARNVHEELTDIGDVTVESVKRLDRGVSAAELSEITHRIHSLSARQKEILLRAIDCGYYNLPRDCNVDQLADVDTAGMSTVAEHLRRGEAEIIKAVSPLLDKAE
jgi:predicted DNA binding protein